MTDSKCSICFLELTEKYVDGKSFIVRKAQEAIDQIDKIKKSMTDERNDNCCDKIKIIKNDDENLENIYLTNCNVQLDSEHYKDVEELTKRIEKLEELAQERAHLINYKSYLSLSDKIDKLENFIPDVLQCFEKRIIDLEESYQGLSSELNWIIDQIKNKSISKQSHNCHICDGNGIIKNPFLVMDIICSSCEWKGIVWG